MGLGDWLQRLLPRKVAPSQIERAKRVLAGSAAFDLIGVYPYFPPREFLNEFLMQGHDPCTQERWMNEWAPFTLTAEEYREVLEWWVTDHPRTVANALGGDCWRDWEYVVFNLSAVEETPPGGGPAAKPDAAPDGNRM